MTTDGLVLKQIGSWNLGRAHALTGTPRQVLADELAEAYQRGYSAHTPTEYQRPTGPKNRRRAHAAEALKRARIAANGVRR